MKVLSLIASATEMVAALGKTSWLVGRSHECDTPGSVRALPEITRPAFACEGSSREIDERVKSRVKDALSIYEVDRERLRSLAPDVILTQTQCEVCAVSLADVEKAVAEWTGHRPRIVSLNPNRLEDIWEDFRRVAFALGCEREGERRIAELKGQINAIARISSRLTAGSAANAGRPRVALIEWMDPLMAAGNWMPELVRLAGGEPVLGEAGKHSPQIAWAELAAPDPDVIIVAPCGFDIERTQAEFSLLRDRTEFRALRAVREGRVFIADGNQFFNRPGPRTVQALEILAEILHPGKFEFERDEKGWAKVELKAN